ncbi:MAG: RNA 2'-phosphotransferase [Ruminococcus flavefaciens]|nr:RNA 2'-phosphotransferase [Ruminococcus flavefaciens]MCM1229660.1 RNA 2'-phosphotransferase [Ruminococcus flavefaciens]
MKQDLTKLSIFISLILRHQPSAIGIELERNGAWADTKELIDGINAGSQYTIDMETLEKIVDDDKKQRYSFNEDKSKIRANQGHSVDVDMGFAEKIPPEILYHGTAERFVDSILAEGLKKGSRQYVHLSADEETASKVGIRHGKPHIFRVLAGEMHRKGYKFHCSENGVWLTDYVPTEFLE